MKVSENTCMKVSENTCTKVSENTCMKVSENTCMKVSEYTCTKVSENTCMKVSGNTCKSVWKNTPNASGISHSANASVMCSKVSSHCPNRCLLRYFFGSPDAVSQLPDTVTQLGLSISSAKESKQVSALKTWQKLNTLREWREKRVAGIRDLNITVKKCLYFLFTS